MIKRIKIHNSNALKDPAYRFPGNYGVEKFLELFSGKLFNILSFIWRYKKYVREINEKCNEIFRFFWHEFRENDGKM